MNARDANQVMFEDIADRLIETANSEFSPASQKAIRRWASYCESPIETLFLSALTLSQSLWNWALGDDCITIDIKRQTTDFVRNKSATITIVPQFEWENYRIDFACFIREYETPIAFMECDGHAFHERTPEQAERDRRRDRAIQQAGIAILRFTGREIYRDPFDCADQLLGFVRKRREGADG